MREAAELLPRAEAVAVSRADRRRAGRAAGGARPGWSRDSAAAPTIAGPARLHVDRVFTIRGAGTVVTGTLWSGAIGRGDELELLPERPAGPRPRRAGPRPAGGASAPAGQRVAVNLTGVPRSTRWRAEMCLTAPGSELAADLPDRRRSWTSTATLSPEPATGSRSTTAPARRPPALAWLGGSFWQLRLEQPLVPAAGDRLVIRQIAPPDTLGGGAVLDAQPTKHGPSRDLLARLERLARGEPVEPSRRTPGSAPPREPRRQAAAPGATARQRRWRSSSGCARPAPSRRSTPSSTRATWPRSAKPAALSACRGPALPPGGAGRAAPRS